MAGNGGIIGPVNTVTNGCAVCATAPGMWQMNTVYNFVKNSNWVYNFSSIDYTVIAGGGGGGGGVGSGGGAGGMVSSYCNPSAAALITKSGTYNVVVGAGGAGIPAPEQGPGTDGVDSSFETITATAGGRGTKQDGGGPGGSGGGGPGYGPPTGVAGSGNTPAAPAALGGPQGNSGGTNPTSPGVPYGSGGGGGAGAVGSNIPGVSNDGGAGGAGRANSITGAPVLYAGGGGGSPYGNPAGTTAGGSGGGGNSGNPASPAPVQASMAGTVNLGGGGGGTGESPKTIAGGSGGSGVVYLRFPSAANVVVSPGTNTVTTCVGPANDKVAKFTVSGTNTITF